MHRANPFKPAEQTDAPILLDDLEATRLRGRLSLKRSPIWLIAWILIGLAIFFSLSLLKPLLRPLPPVDGWVIEPSNIFLYGVSFFGPAFIVPILLRPLVRRWRTDDAAIGLPAVQARFRPVILALVIGLVTVVALVNSVLGFQVVGPSGVHVFRLVRFVDYPYSRVSRLEVLPENYRLTGRDEHGPSGMVTFDNGSVFRFGHNNGFTSAEVDQIASYVAAKSGQSIRMPATAKRK